MAIESLVSSDQPQVRLVDQSGSVQCLPRPLLGLPHGRELPQLVVHEREQLSGGLPVATGRLLQQSRHGVT